MPRPIPNNAYYDQPQQDLRFFAKIKHSVSPYRDVPVEPYREVPVEPYREVPVEPYREVPVEPIDNNANTRFTHLSHIYHLIQLKSESGSAEYLSYCQTLSQFTISHYLAWKKLLLNQNISVAEALDTMRDLSEHQANAIARGFSREQVLDEPFIQSLFQRP